MLFIYSVSDKGQCWLRYDLFDKDHASPPLTITGFVPYIKPQVHFLEGMVERDPESHYFRIDEHESDKTHVTSTFPDIELGPVWKVFIQKRGLNSVVGHGQLPPLRSQKGFRHREKLTPKEKNSFFMDDVPVRFFRKKTRYPLHVIGHAFTYLPEPPFFQPKTGGVAKMVF
jgi:hypothetical protein